MSFSDEDIFNRKFGSTLTLNLDGSATAMSLSPWGRDVVLAGRKGLYIIDLDNPFSPPRWLRHLTSFEVADVQWCPHSYHPDYIASTLNQKAIVWSLLKPSSNAHELILYGGHERAISDLNFHNLNPNLLGTCSIDSTCNIWDFRQSQKPSLIVSDWGFSSTQIKFNHFNEHIFASTHANRLSIWDMRFLNNKPVSRIVAHDSKINGLHFSKTDEFELITCSNDKNIKSWNCESMEQNYVIQTEFPIKLARKLPFGDGLAILPVRGSNAAFIMESPKINTINKLNPVHVFDGNVHNIKKLISEILWLTNSETNQYQLISWSEDKILQRWSPCDELLQKFNCKTLKSPTVSGKFDHKRLIHHKSIVDKEFKYVSYRNEPKARLNQETNLGISTILTSDVNWTNQRLIGNNNDHLNWILNVKSADNDPYNLACELQQNNDFIRQYNINLDEINIAKGLLNFSLFSPIFDIDLRNLIVTPDTKFLAGLGDFNKGKSESPNDSNNQKSLGKNKTEKNNKYNADFKDQLGSINDSVNFTKEEAGKNNTNENNDLENDSKNTPLNSTALKDEDEDNENDYVFLTFKVKLPQNYPFKACPEFSIETASNNSFSSSLRRKLLDKRDGEEHLIIKCLRYIAATCTDVDRYCLDYIFQFLSGIQIDLTEFITIDEEDSRIQLMNKKTKSSQDMMNFVIGEDGSIQVENAESSELINEKNNIDIDSASSATTTDDDMDDDEYLLEGENIATFMDGNFMSKSDTYEDNNILDVSRNNMNMANMNLSNGINLKYLNNTPPEIRCGARWAPNGELIYFTNCGVRYNECYFKSWITIKNGETNQYYNLKMIKDDGNEGRKQLISEISPGVDGPKYDDTRDISLKNYDELERSDIDDLEYDNEPEEEDDIFDNDEDKNKFAFNVTSKLDFTSILPSKLNLGKSYEITIGRKDIFNIAQHNAKISRDLLLNESYFDNDMVDINHCWNIVKIMLLEKELLSDVEDIRLNRGIENHDFRLSNRWSKTFNGSNEYDWGLALHGFGSNGLIKDMFDYFEYKHDIQMLAMLSCVLIEKGKLTNYFYTNSNFIEKCDDPSTFLFMATKEDKNLDASDTLSNDLLFLTQYEVQNYPEMNLNIEIDPFGNMKEDYSLVNDVSFRNRLKKYRDIYSNMLLAWNLPLKRVEILKYNYKYNDTEPYKLPGYDHKLKDSSYSFLEIKYSKECKTLKCCYCHVNLNKEKILLCNNCHHVLHLKCSKEWFGEINLEANDTECPSGCGCKCPKHL